MLIVVFSLFDCCAEDVTWVIVVGGDATEFLSERCQLEPLESPQALVRLLDFGRFLMSIILNFYYKPGPTSLSRPSSRPYHVTQGQPPPLSLKMFQPLHWPKQGTDIIENPSHNKTRSRHASMTLWKIEICSGNPENTQNESSL